MRPIVRNHVAPLARAASSFRQQFGNFEAGLYFMAGIALFGAVLMWIAARNAEQILLGQAPASA